MKINESNFYSILDRLISQYSYYGKLDNVNIENICRHIKYKIPSHIGSNFSMNPFIDNSHQFMGINIEDYIKLISDALLLSIMEESPEELIHLVTHMSGAKKYYAKLGHMHMPNKLNDYEISNSSIHTMSTPTIKLYNIDNYNLWIDDDVDNELILVKSDIAGDEEIVLKEFPYYEDQATAIKLAQDLITNLYAETVDINELLY